MSHGAVVMRRRRVRVAARRACDASRPTVERRTWLTCCLGGRFRPLPPAATQVRPCVVGPSVPMNDRCGEPVLARIWHGRSRPSMRTTGRLVNDGQSPRWLSCTCQISNTHHRFGCCTLSAHRPGLTRKSLGIKLRLRLCLILTLTPQSTGRCCDRHSGNHSAVDQH
jgi:hypothetical protein